jgi:hypothetical protein
MRAFLAILVVAAASNEITSVSSTPRADVVVIGCVADTAESIPSAVSDVSVRPRGYLAGALSDSTGYYRFALDSANLPLMVEWRRIGYRSQERAVGVATQRLIKMPLIVLAPADDLVSVRSDSERQRQREAWERARRRFSELLVACRHLVDTLRVRAR